MTAVRCAPKPSSEWPTDPAATERSAPPASCGQVGRYWYHEDTLAYFDDVDQYRVIEAIGRLSCSVCDKNAEHQGNENKEEGQI
ncbi:hypothetical protein BHE74_00043353 [Ensete ventricosum]|nr:hypothetical protein BHE74_00043353 [Ensete ventricosum]